MGQAQPLGPDPVRLRHPRGGGHSHCTGTTCEFAQEPVSDETGEGERPDGRVADRGKRNRVACPGGGENWVDIRKPLGASQSLRGAVLAVLSRGKIKNVLKCFLTMQIFLRLVDHAGEAQTRPQEN